MPTINEYVGSIDDLQRELGRVTTALAREWDDETWRANAKWAHQIIEGDTLSGHRINWLASAGLMPNTHIITERWGSVPEYRIKNGVETRKAIIEARNWTRDDFINNGKSFAEKLGRDIGIPLMPRQDDIYSADRNEFPSMSQIESEFGSLEEYQAALGFVTSKVARNWTDEEWRENFKWLVEIYAVRGEKVNSVRDMLEAAGRLHIGPSIDIAVERWGNLVGYSKHVGFESHQLKRALSQEGILRAAINLSASLKRPLTREDLMRHPHMGVTMIKRRFGALTELNFQLGWITNTRGWSTDKLLWWGFSSFLEEEDSMPSNGDLEIYSKSNRGPSPTKIYNSFNHSLAEFHAKLDSAQDWALNQIKILSSPNSRISRGLNPAICYQALRRNSDIFHPTADLDPNEIKIFYDLSEAHVNQQLLINLMEGGISFSDPEPQINDLFKELDSKGCLNSANLKKLMPYIPGLAPLSVNSSWTQAIKDYRANRT
jgi:hypothetical protein